MKGRNVPPPPAPFDIQQFLSDRRTALLSMDKAIIVAYMQKYGNYKVPDEAVFWGGVHKARTAAKDLPMEARTESKRWLLACGLKPEDDGDVPI